MAPTNTPTTANALPDNVLYDGLSGRYVALMEPTTEAPPEFHLAAFLTVAGLLFADVGLHEGGYVHYPTLYTLLVGPTGQARKTTVTNAAEQLLADVDPAIPVIHPEGSRQGIMEALIRVSRGPLGMVDGPTLAAIQRGDIVAAEGSAVGVPTLLRAGEFTTTLRQAGRSVTGDLTEFWLRLYDRPNRLESNTRHNPLTILNPCVVLLGDATEEALADLFGEQNVHNGFLNRLSLWKGNAVGKPKARPPAADPDERTAIIAELRRLRAALPRDSRMEWGDEGGADFDRLYETTLFQRRNGPNGSALAREESQVKRYAILYAILRGSSTIDAQDVTKAWAIVAYLSEGALSLAGKVSQGGRAKSLVVVEEVIARKATEGNPLRATPGYIGRNLSPGQRSRLDDWGGVSALVDRLAADHRILALESDHEPDGVTRSYYYTPETVPGNIGAVLAGTVHE